MLKDTGTRVARDVDPLAVIESAYDLGGTDERWLSGILERLAPAVDRGRGVLAYLYDAAERPLRVWNMVGDFEPSPKEVIDVINAADDDYVATSYLVTPFGTASEQPGFDRQVTFRKRLEPYGIRDAMAINGVDTSGLGVWLGGFLPEKGSVSEEERSLWTKVSTHIVAALRLRRRLGKEPVVAHAGGRAFVDRADAVLRTNGKLEHATNDCVAGARTILVEAVRRLEQTRARLRRTDPDEALDAWKVLVRARWSLVDQFESDGKRFVLAYHNAPSNQGPLAFTLREREIVALAMLGRSPKLIAYELGLAPSTVRVHLMNASRKLGARSLKGLLSKYRAWLLRTPRSGK